MKTIKITLTALALSATAFAQTGQTVNEGILYVSPGTLVSVESDFDNTAMGEYENNGEVIFKRNFNNDGITTFDPSYTGYTRFTGSVQQDITGSIPADFYDVLFHNSNWQPAFRLYGDISISGNADFYQGIVQNDVFGGIIIFENEATHTNLSNNSHVDGHVVKNGDTGFIYPIGDSQYFRYAAISAVDAEGSFMGKYFFEDSNPVYPHTSKAENIILIDNKEYWTVDKTSGQADVILTLSWDEDNTTPAEIIGTQAGELHIVRWDTEQSKWVDEGGIVDEGEKTVTTPVNVSGYGVFTLARVKPVLPPAQDVVIYNGVTPDGDGQNDYFIIENITNFPGNKVEVYNRWGVKVFETLDYDTRGNVFSGFSSGRVTVSQSQRLPAGTYFYVIEYPANGTTVKKTGYLYISAE